MQVAVVFLQDRDDERRLKLNSGLFFEAKKTAPQFLSLLFSYFKMRGEVVACAISYTQ